MSRYLEGECEFTRIPELIEALMGVDNCVGRKWTEKDIKVHLEPDQTVLAEQLRQKYPKMQVSTQGKANLEGYEGDKRKQKANVVIPRAVVGGASNDIGFDVKSKGSKQFVSDYDRGYYNKAWGTRLSDKYNMADMKRKCRVNGWKWRESEDKEGNKQLFIENL